MTLLCKRSAVLLSAAVLLLNACTLLQAPAPVTSASSVHSAQWYALGETADGARHELDLNSKKQQGGNITYRVRTSHFPAAHAPEETGIPPHDYMIGLWQMDCSHKTYRILSAQFFRQNGELLQQKRFHAIEEKNIGGSTTSAYRQYRIMCMGIL